MLVLFCSAGGDSAGYARAGFQLVGVDIKPQPHYPFEFIQGDALRLGRELLASGEFDAVVGSPPCHDHSTLKHTMGRIHGTAWMVSATRELFSSSGLPWIIENVPGAPLRSPIILCGSMFGLGAQCTDGYRQLRRHRLFEANFQVASPGPCRHEGGAIGVHGGGPVVRPPGAGRGGYQGLKAECVAAMGIDWMNKAELSQAIPPAYTEHLGKQLAAQVAASSCLRG